MVFKETESAVKLTESHASPIVHIFFGLIFTDILLVFGQDGQGKGIIAIDINMFQTFDIRLILAVVLYITLVVSSCMLRLIYIRILILAIKAVQWTVDLFNVPILAEMLNDTLSLLIFGFSRWQRCTSVEEQKYLTVSGVLQKAIETNSQVLYNIYKQEQANNIRFSNNIDLLFMFSLGIIIEYVADKGLLLYLLNMLKVDVLTYTLKYFIYFWIFLSLWLGLGIYMPSNELERTCVKK